MDPSSSNYVNREIGWLKFNERVLFQAKDSRNPLLERIKFLNIFTSNLDEFYMKRVGALQRRFYAGYTGLSNDGLSTIEQLNLIRAEVLALTSELRPLLRNELLPDLGKNGIFLLTWKDLTKEEKKWAKTFFKEQLYGVLTPMAVDLGHPFPLISNLSTSLAVSLKTKKEEEDLHFARIKVPDMFPEWILIPQDINPDPALRYVSLVDIIRKHLDMLFPQMHIEKVMTFRVTRNLDVDSDPEEAEDLLELIEDQMKKRKFADVVRLEHGPKPDLWLLSFLIEELELEPTDIYEFPLPIEFKNLSELMKIAKPDLKFKPWVPVAPVPLNDENTNIFSLIKSSDLLMHMPYDSFSASTERFIVQASKDPDVLALKITVYRTGTESEIVKALIRASEAGKQVVCLVELNARMDEERNIRWAHAMERAGVHVVYGIVGLKTHAKIALVVKKDRDGVRNYAHIGTGNFHSMTSRVYTDFSLFTCDPTITHELIEVFHYLTGRSLKSDYQKLLVAPVNLKVEILNLIQQEIELCKSGGSGRIIIKCNNLEDPNTIDKLYEASQAGVQIDLIVRGFCCLKPQVLGLSENIRVISVIGPFLEHSRVFYFQAGQLEPVKGKFFIGSADLMSRNLLGRVEVVTPVESPPLRQKIWNYIDLLLKDQRLAWDMKSDGTYEIRNPKEESDLGSHMSMSEMTKNLQIQQLENMKAQVIPPPQTNIEKQ